MDNAFIGVWNIRGLNRLEKQKEVRLYRNKFSFQFFAVLETRIKSTDFRFVPTIFGSNWQHASNITLARNMWILLLWNASEVKVNVLATSDQMMHYWVENGSGLSRAMSLLSMLVILK